jgi:hypothetical protein
LSCAGERRPGRSPSSRYFFEMFQNTGAGEIIVPSMLLRIA